MADGPGALPTFQADLSQATRVRSFDGAAGAEQASVFGNLSRELGSWMDRAAQDVGKQQGEVAGLDANYRPDQDESLMGIARRNAANAAYGNNLEASARTALGDAWQQFSQLPPDQRSPAALQKTFAGIKDEFDKNHVFDTVAGPFNLAFGRMSDVYMRQAQSDQDQRQQNAAKASFLVNQNSARDSALKIASLPSATDADVVEQVRQHDAAVEQQVKAGVLTPTQAVEIKNGFKQDVLSQRILTQFNQVPDSQKGAFLAAFRSKFLGTAGSETGDQLAARIRAVEPSLTNEQCVELARKVSGISETVTAWRKGQSATETRLPVGTPVATFLNRDGSPSDRYDGGAGVGAPGNNTTHAAIVAGYTPEGDLQLWEQYQGSGGPRLTTYKRGDARGGEKDANNYFSINGPNGQALGSSNPLAVKSAPAANTSGLDFETEQKLEKAMGGIADRVAGEMDAVVRAQASQAAHAQKLALGDIQSDTKQMEAGYGVKDEEWAAKRAQYAASPDPEVRDAFDTADRIRTLYAGFAGRPPQEIEAEVATLKAALAQGASPKQAEIVQAADKYAQRLRKDFDRDPLARAAADGVIPALTPLDFTSPQAAAQTLRSRLAAADQVAQHYHMGRTPLVTPDDKEAIKALAAAGGEPMVQAAATIAQTLGPRAQQFFSEVGGEAPSFAHIGVLAANGADPGLLRDAAWAIQQDHATGGKVQRPSPEMLQTNIGTAYGDAFRAIPSFAQGAKAVASSALAAQIMREGSDPKALDGDTINKTLQRAAGATYVGSVQYGGVASAPWGRWSSQKVLAPSNVRATQLAAVIREITDKDLASLPAPPKAADGTVMPASALKDLRLTSLGPGVYALSKGDPMGEDPQWVTYQGGQRGTGGRFVLDLNDMEPQLRARIPGAYK